MPPFINAFGFLSDPFGPVRTSKVFLINFLKQLSSQFHANPTNPAVFLQAHKHNADKTEYWNQR